MKKLLIVLFSILMLMGCTPKDEPVPVPDPDPETEIKHELPGHILTGYWVNTDTDVIFQFVSDSDFSITSVCFGDLEDRPKDYTYADFEEANYYGDGFELKFKEENGLAAILINVIFDEKSNDKININGSDYERIPNTYASIDYVRIDYMCENIDRFFRMTKGYWNSDEGTFIRIQEDDEGNRCFMIGIYDAGGPAEGYLKDIWSSNGNAILKEIDILVPGRPYPPFPEKDQIVSYELDMDGIPDDILIYKETPFYFAGLEWDSAYADFQARRHN